MADPTPKEWWLIVQHQADVPAVWHLGGATDRDLAELVDAVRVVMGIPADDSGTSAQWDVQLTYDEPRDTLLARATMRDPAELLAVTPAALDEFRAAVHAAGRQGRLEAARAALAQLSDDEVQTLIGGS